MPVASDKIVFTAAPNGKLIDGSDGKTATFNLAWDPLSGVRPNGINDLPLALKGWHITANLTHADGSTIALLLKVVNDPKYVSAIDVKMLSPPAGSMAAGLPAMGVPIMVCVPAP